MLNLNEGAPLLVNSSLPCMEHAEKPIRLNQEGDGGGRSRSECFPRRVEDTKGMWKLRESGEDETPEDSVSSECQGINL